MTPAQSRADTGLWSVPGHATVIEYSRPVLNSILLHVLDSYETFLAGGYEVGGVLYGEHTAGRVRILAFRTLEINPPRPSFVLSAKDEKNLGLLLKAPGDDGELEGMEPVGWYHSHTRSEVFLSESDLEIYDTFFPEPWQVAIVFRPNAGEPVRAGFFFRESDGFIRADQSYQEISFEPPERRAVAPGRPPWVITEEGEPVEPDLSMLDSEPEPEPPIREAPRPVAIRVAEPEPMATVAELEPVRRARSGIGGWVFFAALLAAVLTGVSYLRFLKAPEPPLGLDVMVREGDLLIRWNPRSAAIDDAQSAVLFIVDGSRRLDRPLSGLQLRRAAETYRHSSPRVDVRLQINRPWGRTRQEIATYLAHPDRGKPSPELLEARQELQDADVELNQLRSEMLNQWQKSERLRTRIDELQQRREQLAVAQGRRAPQRQFAIAPLPKPQVVRDLPTAPDLASPRPMAQSTIPQQQEVRLSPPPAPAPPPVAPPKPAAPKPAAAVVVETPKPAPAATFGRFLWSGDLSRNGVLTIDGRSASNGTVTGELPGVAVRVGAYPAEFSGDMLKVYTPNPRYATQPRIDPPSAGNGWNRTQYLYDQRAARDVIVEQFPNGASKRMVVRAGARNVSVILIEWQVAGQ
ncbi:MAG: hypothetical protein SFV51_17610 [Bryobacteraceae bacterium]|nr:hypothetical protein [Bryobacteraceae bacterium]